MDNISKRHCTEVNDCISRIVKELTSPDNLGDTLIEVPASKNDTVNRIVIKKFRSCGYYIDVCHNSHFEKVFSINFLYENV